MGCYIYKGWLFRSCEQPWYKSERIKSFNAAFEVCRRSFRTTETPGCSVFANSYNKNDDNSIVVVSGEFEIGYTDVKEFQFFCGKDWNFDAFDKHYETTLLPKAPAELVNSTPYLSPDGSLILGSKSMTTFLIDAKTGNVIHIYDSGVPLSTDEANMFFHDKYVVSDENIVNRTESGTVDLSSIEPIFITWKDYPLRSYKVNAAKIQWNVSTAEIDAYGLCWLQWYHLLGYALFVGMAEV